MNASDLRLDPAQAGERSKQSGEQHGVSRDAKTDEILALAVQRLQEGGYGALSIAAVAWELGLAQNTIYWYFPSKDELFVATLERMLEEIAARKPTRDAGAVAQILWFTGQFHALSDLRAAMRERAPTHRWSRTSSRISMSRLSRMLSNAQRDRVSADGLPVAVEMFRATVEGTFVKRLDQAQRHRVLGFALAKLIDRPGEI
jgi:AcrR family transcriptional regulator